MRFRSNAKLSDISSKSCLKMNDRSRFLPFLVMHWFKIVYRHKAESLLRLNFFRSVMSDSTLLFNSSKIIDVLRFTKQTPELKLSRL